MRWLRLMHRSYFGRPNFGASRQLDVERPSGPNGNFLSFTSLREIPFSRKLVFKWSC